MGIKVAFYHGKGDWIDCLIRFFTRSKFSHCEVVLNHAPQGLSLCASASPRDGGVRFKEIDLSSGRWVVLSVDWLPRFEGDYLLEAVGSKYDFIGVFFSHVFAFRRQSSTRWFCSELCAAMLGLRAAETYSPHTLKLTIEQMNFAYKSGREAGKCLNTKRP